MNGKFHAVILFFCIIPGYAVFPIDFNSVEQRQLLDFAETLRVQQNYYIDGQRYNRDCSGTVMGIYAGAGMKLLNLISGYSGGGVERLYRLSAENNLLYSGYFPEVGDLVFWDNSYDRNGDGIWNDPLTHIGMVVGIDADATVSFIHYSVIDGVTVETMNLLYPDSLEYNSIMRIAGDTRPQHPELRTSAHLFRIFSKPYRLWGE